MKRSFSGAAMVPLLLAAACGPKPTPAWHQETGYRWRELNVSVGTPGFTRMDAKRTGIEFQNTVSDSILLGNRMLGQGAGVALGDVDGDGRVDVFLARTEGCSALYKNLGDWHFEDITRSAGVGACDRHSTGAAFADVDGDGNLDLILLSTTGPNAIFINDGKGHFTEHRDLGLDPRGKGGTSITMADVDGSGRLDLYVANYKAYHPVDTIPPQDRASNRVVRKIGPGLYDVVPERQRDYKLVTRPDMGGLNLTMRGEPDDFYTNDGTGHFHRASFTSNRFQDAHGRALTAEPESFALSARFADLNGDGAPDLYVCNDFEDPDQLWINDRHGHFRLADWMSQRQTSNSSMGVDVADVNGDGLPDLFVVDMLSKDSRRLKTQMPTHSPRPKLPGDIETQLQQQRNTLFLNRGDGTFAEASAYAGVQASGWSWATMFLDVDLDGRPDILVANGHLWDLMDGDSQEALQQPLGASALGASGPGAADWRHERWRFPSLPLTNVAFRNRGDLTFEDVSDKWRFAGESAISNTMAAADLDGDGDLDVVVNRLRSPALILRNDGSAPRVAVRLVGDAPNTRAVGSTIRLLGGAVPAQQHEVGVGGLYMSHSDYLATFAMGTSQSATLVVDWRDGRRTTIANVKPNRLYEIGTATASARPSADSAKQAPRATLFEDATALLGGHAHVEPVYDDWNKQFLLPNALSQLGPGVAWFDTDRSGYEDLIIGSGRGGRLGVFHNDHGRLIPRPGQGPLAPADFTSVLGLAEQGSSRLLLGVSSWEGQSVPSVLGVDAGGTISAAAAAVLPPLSSATGPMALGDYDGDGTLDLFVGGRVIPGRYPVAASSALYKNVNGRFVLDTANSESLRDIGLVSSAMFADINGDGKPDLLLAREWGSIVLFLNEGGHFIRAPASWGLDRFTSRWIGVAAGDLNGDGKLDIVATSWGRNTMLSADRTRPLVMFHGPFGASGEEELLLARQDQRLGALAPLNSYARVRTAIPGLTQRIRTFAAYADATVDQVLGPFAPRATRTDVVTMDHMIFLNKGDHFEASSLPAEAQLAPASYVGVADFDGDGFEDVFLSQNFFPTAVGFPRYDAGRGLLLTGNGTGGLTPMPGAESGILVYGDQRGAAYGDYDHDGRLDLAITQNGAATRLFHNRGAKPGLRVRLRGSSLNPDAIGAQIRIVYPDHIGPVREIQSGSGYWSQNGAVQVMGLSAQPTALWVRWPGGAVTQTPISSIAREIELRQPSRP